MSVVRLAVIGAGAWGRNHVRTLAAMSGVELAVVADVSAQRRDELARQYPSLRVVESYTDAFDCDGVVVATPASTHTEIALAAIAAGRPVLIEKPMALSAQDAQAVVAQAEATNVPVLVGHLLLFHPALEQLREHVRTGDLGRVYYLYSQRVNLGQVRPDENALWSFGPHDVSVAVAMLDEAPVSVAAHGKSYLQPGVEDVVFFNMEFASGTLAHVQMSWLDPHKARTLTVVGSHKMVVFDDMQPREKLKIYDKGISHPPDYGSYGESLTVREGDIWIPKIPNREPLRAELEHFAEVVRGNTAPRVTARDGLRVVRILESASDSLRNGGRVVSVELDETR